MLAEAGVDFEIVPGVDPWRCPVSAHWSRTGRRRPGHDREAAVRLAVIRSLTLELRRAGDDVVDLGFGNPDLRHPQGLAVEKLSEAAHNPAEPPLLGLEGDPQPAPRLRDPLPAPLRRRARPRARGAEHDRRQGGSVASDVGAARAGRLRAGAEPELPDPRLRADLCRGRRSRACRWGRTRTCSRTSRTRGSGRSRSLASSSSRSRTTRDRGSRPACSWSCGRSRRPGRAASRRAATRSASPCRERVTGSGSRAT